jgi:hypothetical protein
MGVVRPSVEGFKDVNAQWAARQSLLIIVCCKAIIVYRSLITDQGGFFGKV